MRSALILNPLPRTSSKGEEDKWKEEASKWQRLCDEAWKLNDHKGTRWRHGHQICRESARADASAAIGVQPSTGRCCWHLHSLLQPDHVLLSRLSWQT